MLVLNLMTKSIFQKTILKIFAKAGVDQCGPLFLLKYFKQFKRNICTGRGGPTWTAGWNWVTQVALYLASRYDDHDDEERSNDGDGDDDDDNDIVDYNDGDEDDDDSDDDEDDGYDDDDHDQA